LNLDDVKLQNDAALGQSLRIAAEQAKKAVCSHNVYEGKVYDYLLKLDESTFNELAFSLVDKTIDSCKKAVQDAKLAITDINKVILVGGSTRIPLVKERLSQFFEQTPDDSMNPDEVVALGAAIQADILAGNRKDILLLDVTPLSLGIETVGGLMDSIITRNAKVPHRAARQYTTSIDGQKNLRISVFQGERDLVAHNRKLGEFTLRNIPPMPAGIPKIEVQFLLDADGILTVKAKELRSGTETSVEIKSAYSISEEEMAKMLLDSIRNAASDVNQRALLEAINEANNLVLSADKFVVQNASILSKEEVESIVSLNGSLKNAIKNQNKNDIESAMQALNVYTTPLAHKALDQNIQHALKSTTIS
jgi:molecular chaperone HscA